MAAQRQLCGVSDWRLAEQTDFDYQAFRLPPQGVFLRDSAAEILTKHPPAPTAGSHFSSVTILTFPWARKNSPVGAQIMPNGGAVTTPIMHLADFLTESSRLIVMFVKLCYTDILLGSAMIKRARHCAHLGRIFAFSHFRKKKKERKGKR